MTTAIVVGGGVIGAACAVELQRRGLAVTLIDRAEPGRGCSYGNAGIIAASDVFPLITAKRIAALPRMLFDPDGPARIRADAFPALFPWLARAAATLAPRRQAQIVAALGALNGAALESWRDLLQHCGAEAMLVERGMLELLALHGSRVEADRQAQRLRDLGQKVSVLDASQVRDLEPELADRRAFALMHHGNAHVRDPFRLVEILIERFRAGGGIVLEEEVHAIVPAADVLQIRTSAGTRQARSAVIAAGAQSPRFLSNFGLRAPIQIERGYHLHLPEGEGLMSRPVAFQEASFVATPMVGGIRFAGTVEFARPDSEPDWTRAALLAKHAYPYFNSHSRSIGGTRWVGERPSLPDSLPAIGKVRGVSGLFYAFGHQHLGLTQAAITARIVTSLVTGAEPPFPTEGLDAERFGRGMVRQMRRAPTLGDD